MTLARRIKLKSEGMCREYCGRKSMPGHYKCRECLDKESKRKRERNNSDPRLIMFTNAKTRAKESGLPFSISLDDIHIPKYCPVFGIELRRGFKRICDSSPTLDKIIPDLGYIPSNIIVMSRLANRLKNNSSLDQLIALGKWASKMKGKNSASR